MYAITHILTQDILREGKKLWNFLKFRERIILEIKNDFSFFSEMNLIQCLFPNFGNPKKNKKKSSKFQRRIISGFHFSVVKKDNRTPDERIYSAITLCNSPHIDKALSFCGMGSMNMQRIFAIVHCIALHCIIIAAHVVQSICMVYVQCARI